MDIHLGLTSCLASGCTPWSLERAVTDVCQAMYAWQNNEVNLLQDSVGTHCQHVQRKDGCVTTAMICGGTEQLRVVLIDPETLDCTCAYLANFSQHDTFVDLGAAVRQRGDCHWCTWQWQGGQLPRPTVSTSCEVCREQERREERQRIRKEAGGALDPLDEDGSFDDGDPYTTNLYIGQTSNSILAEELFVIHSSSPLFWTMLQGSPGHRWLYC